MKILLIDFNFELSSIGVRYLSAALNAQGHDTSILFLPNKDIEKNRTFSDFTAGETEEQLEKICAFVKAQRPVWVGMSLMTCHFSRATAVTKALKKKVGIPVIWGGIHPTIHPQECLEHADAVCIGEGEEAITEFASRFDSEPNYFETESFWFNKGGAVVRNKIRPLKEKLDDLPFPDYELSRQFVFDEGEVKNLDEKLLKKYSPHLQARTTYRIICTRGCPYSCAYCYNSFLRNLYPNSQCYLRRRSVENVIEELSAVKKKFPFIELIRIMDDSFIACDEKWVKQFAEEYSKRIALPFSCLVNPQTVTADKLKWLAEAGMIHVQMGIEASERVNQEIYGWHTTDKQILNAIQTIKSAASDAVPEFDIIVDNPYETEEDELKKLLLLLEVPKPYELGVYSLTLYSHTPLYERAQKDGFLTSDNTSYSKNMSKVGFTFYNQLILVSPYLPKKVVRYLARNRNWVNEKLAALLYADVYELPRRMPRSVKDILKKMKRVLRA